MGRSHGASSGGGKQRVAARFSFGKMPGNNGWRTYTVSAFAMVASAFN